MTLINYTPLGWTGRDDRSDTPETARLRKALEDALVSGAIPYVALPYTNQPTDTQTVTIGSDVYEFCTAAGSVADDGNIGVVIAGSADATMANLVAAINATYKDNEHPTLFQTDDETPALANGTEDVFALLDSSGNVLYLFAADEPGGDKVPGKVASLAVSDTASNVGPWAPLNLNLGVGADVDRIGAVAHVLHTIIAGDLSATQPLLVPVPFTPRSWHLQVRDASGALRDAHVEVTVPSAVGDQAFLGLNLRDTTPTSPKRVALIIPVNDNDSTLLTWFLAKAIRIVGFYFARSETAAAALTVSMDKVTASTAGDAVQLATAVSIAGGTNGAVQTFTPDEAGGALPLDLTALQALAITVAAGNGTVAPRAITLFIDYVELAVATDVLHLTVKG